MTEYSLYLNRTDVRATLVHLDNETALREIDKLPILTADDFSNRNDIERLAGVLRSIATTEMDERQMRNSARMVLVELGLTDQQNVGTSK